MYLFDLCTVDGVGHYLVTSSYDNTAKVSLHRYVPLIIMFAVCVCVCARVHVCVCVCVIISSLSAHPPCPTPRSGSILDGPLKTLAGHVGKVMAVDVSKGE